MRQAPSERRSSTRPFPRLVRTVSLVSILVLGLTTVILVARGPRSSVRSVQKPAERSAQETPMQPVANMRLEPDSTADGQTRGARDGATSVNELVRAYVAGASHANAPDARRLIVKQLLSTPNRRIGIEALLRAIALDTTPRRQDPLWRDLVSGLAQQWDAATFGWGRDLMETEGAPKVKDLLLESFADIEPSKLTSEQQRLLATDLVDHYSGASPDEMPAFDRALAAMGSTDLVEVMHGHGINQGESPLAAIHKIEQEKAASRATYKRILEQIDQEEKAAKETNAREAARSQR